MKLDEILKKTCENQIAFVGKIGIPIQVYKSNQDNIKYSLPNMFLL